MFMSCQFVFHLQSVDHFFVALRRFEMRRRRRSQRRGISLLEVLISMFVMLVGVISVFALITLGRFEMLEGTKSDQAMSLGRRGQHLMLARGFLRPLQFDANMNQYIPMWLTNTGALWGPAYHWKPRMAGGHESVAPLRRQRSQSGPDRLRTRPVRRGGQQFQFAPAGSQCGDCGGTGFFSSLLQ